MARSNPSSYRCYRCADDAGASARKTRQRPPEKDGLKPEQRSDPGVRIEINTRDRANERLRAGTILSYRDEKRWEGCCHRSYSKRMLTGMMARADSNLCNQGNANERKGSL